MREAYKPVIIQNYVLTLATEYNYRNDECLL